MLKPLYRVTALRSGRWWIISVRELRAVHAQVRRLDTAESRAREAIALALGAPQDSFDVSLNADLSSLGALKGPIEEALNARKAADHAQEVAAASLRRAIRDIRAAGYTARDAGVLLGLSNQRISQIERESQATLGPIPD
jgi:hypothetical protein